MNEYALLKHLYRPCVTRIAHLIAPTQMSPIQLSLIAFVISIISAWLFSSEYYAGLFFGALLAFLSLCLHLSAEEIRRLRHLPIESFQKADKALVFYSELFFIAGLAAHIAITDPKILCLLLGLLAATGILLLDKFKERSVKPFLTYLEFIEHPSMRISLMILFAFINLPILAIFLIALCSNGLVFSGLLDKK